jgi:hypothetical protein
MVFVAIKALTMRQGIASESSFARLPAEERRFRLPLPLSVEVGVAFTVLGEVFNRRASALSFNLASIGVNGTVREAPEENPGTGGESCGCVGGSEEVELRP